MISLCSIESRVKKTTNKNGAMHSLLWNPFEKDERKQCFPTGEERMCREHILVSYQTELLLCKRRVIIQRGNQSWHTQWQRMLGTKLEESLPILTSSPLSESYSMQLSYGPEGSTEPESLKGESWDREGRTKAREQLLPSGYFFYL